MAQLLLRGVRAACVRAAPVRALGTKPLAESDPELFALIRGEYRRQRVRAKHKKKKKK